MVNLTQRFVDSWLKNSTISTHPAPGAPDFCRAILTRRRSPGLIPRLGFHIRAFRRGPEHGLGWEFAGAGGGAFRQNAAPDVRTMRPGPDIFFELCFGWGGPRGGFSVSGSTHACPGGGPNIGIFENSGSRFEIFE